MAGNENPGGSHDKRHDEAVVRRAMMGDDLQGEAGEYFIPAVVSEPREDKDKCRCLRAWYHLSQLTDIQLGSHRSYSIAYLTRL